MAKKRKMKKESPKGSFDQRRLESTVLPLLNAHLPIEGLIKVLE